MDLTGLQEIQEQEAYEQHVNEVDMYGYSTQDDSFGNLFGVFMIIFIIMLGYIHMLKEKKGGN